MRVIVQRSKHSKVSVSQKIINEIDFGLVLLVGFTHNDSVENVKKMVKKIVNLRIFDDAKGIMNKSILDIKGQILSISQFTLYADATKGNRPSYIKAMPGNDAIKLYDLFNKYLNEYVPTKSGIFGAEMEVSIINNGPITIALEI